MDKPTVRVHRVSLPSAGYGQIKAGPLHTEGHPFPDGAAVVLETGDGWWMRSDEAQHIARSLANVGHITITGLHHERGGGRGQFGIVYGLAAIAEYLDELLAAPPLFASA